jgi:hypothetical protein
MATVEHPVASTSLSFHDYLTNTLLKDAGLTSARAQHLLSRGDKSKLHAIKAMMRKDRRQHDLAYEHPLIIDLISLLDEQQLHLHAQILRHIVSQQHFAQGLGILNFDAGDPGHPDLTWLRFPQPCADHGEPLHESAHYKKWRYYIAEGDYRFYRASLQLYYCLKDSPCHAPTRLFISGRIARTATSFGDYTDAYIICQRVIDAWTRSSKLLIERDSYQYYAYLDALQIQAVANSSIFFSNPLPTTRALFEYADRELQKHKSRLEQSEYLHLSVLMQVRILRMYCKILMDSAIPQDSLIELAIEICSHAVRLSKHTTRLAAIIEPKNADYFLISDTLSRSFSMLAIRTKGDQIIFPLLKEQPSCSGLANQLNKIKDDDVKSLRLKIRDVKSLFLGCESADAISNKLLDLSRIHFVNSQEFDRAANFEESEYRKYPSRSRQRESRSIITDILRRVASDFQSAAKSSYDVLISSFIEAISPHRMRHQKHIIYSLRDLISGDSIYPEMNENTPTIMSDQAIVESIRTLKDEADLFKEFFFDYDPKTELHLGALREANFFRFRTHDPS